MKHRDAARKATRNAQAIEWARTHTLQDLRDLASEMSDLGEDVEDITRLLSDLSEMDRSLHADSALPEACENETAEIAA
ncbi:MAG: hypothetical protein QXZ19_03635 [Thermoplasmata archaeon]